MTKVMAGMIVSDEAQQCDRSVRHCHTGPGQLPGQIKTDTSRFMSDTVNLGNSSLI